MRRRIAMRALAVASALLLAATACGGSDDGGDDKGVKVLGTDGNMGSGLGDQFAKDEGALDGMRGTTPLTELSGDFKERLDGVKGKLKDYNYSAESYDAVVVTALAAQVARSTEGTAFAPFINSVTTKGEKCESYKACLDLVKQSKDIDYDGVSGPLEFTDAGEPAKASFGLLEFDDKGKVDGDKTKYIVTGDEANASTKAQTAPAQTQSFAGGPLKVGTLLPQTGKLAFLGPPMYAGTKLAIDEVNSNGGVNGEVTLVDGDSGDGGPTAEQTVNRELQADVDVIIGAAASGVSKEVIDRVTNAGVVLFSPANTSDDFTTYDDKGLYFRTAPPDVLQARPLSTVILDEGGSRVGILAQNSPYGKGLAENIKKNLVDGGLESGDVKLVLYDPDAADYSSEVDQVADIDPDFVVVVGYEESAKVIKKMNEKGIGPKD